MSFLFGNDYVGVNAVVIDHIIVVAADVFVVVDINSVIPCEVDVIVIDNYVDCCR